MEGHEAAVWDVELTQDSDQILSASADKTIKAWSAGKCVQTFIGHTDCVRGIAVITNQEFVSCANDATVRRWSLMTADCLQVFYGHTNFVYAIKHYKGLLFTASEDKSVKVWNLLDAKSSDPAQSIAMPSQSNWCLTVFPNGDFAVGCSDASIRVFSSNPSRTADPDELTAFTEEVAASSVPSKSTIGDLKIDELPGPEALFQPGRREGQTIMIREGADLAFCYQWSSSKSKWDKVGQVLGGSGGTQVTSGKQLYKGKEYDYVFSVKLDEDKEALKLPFNVTQDPWHAARQFILDNELDPLFLDQVANFIINNTKGVQLGKTMGNVDPFTGSPAGGSSAPMDTSGPSRQNAPASSHDPGFRPGSNLGNVDPYTGHSAMETSAAPAETEYFPLKDYLDLFNSNFEKDADKIKTYNEQTQFKLSDESLKTVLGVNKEMKSIDNALSDIISCILTWEMDYIFPFFDICIHFAKSESFCKSIEPKFSAILSRVKELRNSASKPSQTMAVRFLANLSGSKFGQNLIRKSSTDLAHVVEEYSNSTIGPVALALSTLNLNLSVLAHEQGAEMEFLYLVPVYSQMLSREALDEETTFRTLVAIGTVCTGCEIMREACKGANLSLMFENVAAKLNSVKIKACSSKLGKLLK